MSMARSSGPSAMSDEEVMDTIRQRDRLRVSTWALSLGVEGQVCVTIAVVGTNTTFIWLPAHQCLDHQHTAASTTTTTIITIISITITTTIITIISITGITSTPPPSSPFSTSQQGAAAAAAELLSW